MCYSSVKDRTTYDNGEKLDNHISDEDYLTCHKIWSEFNIKNVGGYHDHYLKKDVLLIADVFKKFIDTSLKFYKLDSCHYFVSSKLSQDAMLKITGVKLEKRSDTEMYLFNKKGLRGEISYIAKRYAKTNDVYIENHDHTKPSKFIKYLDMNNISRYLPYGRFK